jgi:hypothetical protein
MQAKPSGNVACGKESDLNAVLMQMCTYSKVKERDNKGQPFKA